MNIGNILAHVSRATADELKGIQAVLNGKPKRRTLITTKTACAVLDCHPITLRRLEKRGHLRPIRHSKRKIRWDLNEVEAFANSGLNSTKGGEA